MNRSTLWKKCTSPSQLPYKSASTLVGGWELGWTIWQKFETEESAALAVIDTQTKLSLHPPGCICLALLNKIMDCFCFESWNDYDHIMKSWLSKNTWNMLLNSAISVSFSGKLKWSVERFSVSRVQHFYPFNSDFKNQDIEYSGSGIFKILDFKWNLLVWSFGCWHILCHQSGTFYVKCIDRMQHLIPCFQQKMKTIFNFYWHF